MKTGDIVKRFGVSSATVRRWAMEFEDFLSPSNSRQRTYTAEDYTIMATVYSLSNEGLSLQAIRKRLEEGYRVDSDEILEIGYSDGRMVPAAAVEQIIDASELRAQVDSLQQERDRLTDLMNSMNEKLNHKDEHIAELQGEIKRLERELGRAEGELNYRRELDQKRDQAAKKDDSF